MSESMDNWFVVIPALLSEEFDVILRKWRDENKKFLEERDPSKFEIDTIRGEGGRSFKRLRMQLG